MALTETKLQRLSPQSKAYQVADGGGLFIVVHPTGKKVWRMQYRLGGRGSKKEKITLGEYPAFSIAEARDWREASRESVAHGKSPAAAKQASKEAEVAKLSNTIRAFAEIWYAEVVSKANSEPRNTRRVLDKDVLPAIGDKHLSEVSVEDVLEITDKIKARGADQMTRWYSQRSTERKLSDQGAVARERQLHDSSTIGLQAYKSISSSGLRTPTTRLRTWV